MFTFGIFFKIIDRRSPLLITQLEQHIGVRFSASKDFGLQIKFSLTPLPKQGFQFTFQRGGGMVPPLRGGNELGRGGNAA